VTTYPPASGLAPAGSAWVLLVDDDLVTLHVTAAILEESFEIVTATSGHEALQVLERRQIDVVCTDYVMSGMTGVELLGQAFARFPCVSGVLVTGNREYVTAPSSKSGGARVYDILIKPVPPEQLLRTIRRALERSRVAREIERRAKGLP
jgi:two-component system response regulator HydG